MRFLLTFAFIPARYDADLVAGGSFPGGFGADLWTFFTYAFLHADLLHIGLNVAWLLPFGTALARRFGAWRYTAFMLVVAAAGAFAHLVTHPRSDGADDRRVGGDLRRDGGGFAVRLSARRAARAVARRRRCNAAYRMPASSLMATLRNPRFLIFLGVWIGLNALFGLGSVSIGQGAGQESRGRRTSAASSPACCCSMRSIRWRRSRRDLTRAAAADAWQICL